MLKILRSNVFDSPAQTLVNTVNTVGVMGKGIAAEFKSRFPAMFKEYKKLCDAHTLTIGCLHFWRGPTRCVLNFPTKTTWKKPSKLEYIEAGLKTFVQNYKDLGITSASFPPLGCGNGQLEWGVVKPIMLKHLKNLEIPIFIHEGAIRNLSRPEHIGMSARRPPFTYQEFLNEIHSVIDETGGHLGNSKLGKYTVSFDDNVLKAIVGSKTVVLDEFVEAAWIGLRLGMVNLDTFGDESARYPASLLLPVLSAMPSVTTVDAGSASSRSKSEKALFFDTPSVGAEEVEPATVGPAQKCLSL